ncbi:hypothetical protein BDZ97DRAFT_602109 [Flammula alnicola]|nr:hypothetical protein BDZ97DRAFT_602109 [Flammula alnicola]
MVYLICSSFSLFLLIRCFPFLFWILLLLASRCCTLTMPTGVAFSYFPRRIFSISRIHLSSLSCFWTPISCFFKISDLLSPRPLSKIPECISIAVFFYPPLCTYHYRHARIYPTYISL